MEEKGKKIEFSHRSVLLDECIDALAIRPDGVYLDGTAGGGGHSAEIARHLGDAGLLIAIDQDETAVAVVTERLSSFGLRARVVRNNFCELSEVCREQGIDAIDGLLLDLGVSSHQLDTPERGFSYQADAPLDMRMDKRKSLSAYEVVNTYSQEKLKKILFDYGEERYAPAIASAIVKQREKKPIETTAELSELIKYAIPPAAREGGHHPAKRSFQAIRIEVNAELDVIEPAIRSAVSLLRRGGRIAIITFHSLEDRIVKQFMRDKAQGCTCPKDFPVCVCGNKPRVSLVNRKPILPGKEELERNSRASCAKLRICEKI